MSVLRTCVLLGSLLGSLLVVGCEDSKGDSGGTSGGGEDSGSPSALDGCREGTTDGADTLPPATVEVDAGSFTMGSPEGEAAAREVTLTHPLTVFVHELSQAQWQQLMGTNPAANSTCPTCPVEQVSWHQAVAFAEALNTSEGREACAACTGDGEAVECVTIGDPTACSGWRLPTEAEWEYLARAGSTTAYAGSDTIEDVGWTVENVGSTCPVGQLGANAWGLHDLSGNVWEWVHDGHAAAPTGTIDPTGDDTATERGVRGGSYFNSADSAKVWVRRGVDPATPSPFQGFRLVRSR